MIASGLGLPSHPYNRLAILRLGLGLGLGSNNRLSNTDHHRLFIHTISLPNILKVLLQGAISEYGQCLETF